jgi:hypothetical protein
MPKRLKNNVPATGEEGAKKRVVIEDLPGDDNKSSERLGFESHDQDFEMDHRKKKAKRAIGHKNRVIIVNQIQDQVWFKSTSRLQRASTKNQDPDEKWGGSRTKYEFQVSRGYKAPAQKIKTLMENVGLQDQA